MVQNCECGHDGGVHRGDHGQEGCAKETCGCDEYVPVTPMTEELIERVETLERALAATLTVIDEDVEAADYSARDAEVNRIEGMIK